MKTLTFYFKLLKTSILSSMSLTATFLLEFILMIISNLSFILLWWILFFKFKAIGNWNLSDVFTLNAITIGSLGLKQVAFGGLRYLGKLIADSDLDPLLIQPKNVLLHVAGMKSISKGWGSLMTCFIIIILKQLYVPSKLPLILICIVSGATVFSATSILAFSTLFWLGRIENVSKKYLDSIYLFSIYPTNIYSGFIQMIMFTLIPAGIIGYLPVELIREFSFLKLILLISSSCLFLLISIFVFFRGLKRYESGNQFGFRG